jgi:hypothetical protein
VSVERLKLGAQRLLLSSRAGVSQRSRFDMETRYRHPVTLALAEKVFGPSLNGKGAPDNTLSAIATPANKGRTYIGVPGIEPGAVFYIQFPREIDFGRLPPTPGKPRTPDHIRGLRKDGPLAGQTGRLKSKNGKKIKRSRNALLPPRLRSPNELSFQVNYIFPGSEDRKYGSES